MTKNPANVLHARTVKTATPMKRETIEATKDNPADTRETAIMMFMAAVVKAAAEENRQQLFFINTASVK